MMTGAGRYYRSEYTHHQFVRWCVLLSVTILISPFAVREIFFTGESIRAATTTVTLTASDDAYVDKSAATTNRGSNTTMTVSTNAAGTSITRSILTFDLSAIPSSATITQATLSLYQSGQASGIGGNKVVDVHRLTRGFTEASVTWNTYNGSANWTTAGGDYDAVETGTATLTSGGGNGTERTFTVTADVADFVASNETNYGWIVKLDPESGATPVITFHTSESATAEYRPKLSITYTAPTTPTSTIVSVAQRRDGSGIFDIVATAYDGESDKLKLRLYLSNGACSVDNGQLTLGGTVIASTNDSGGPPDVNAGNYYQVGSTVGTQIVTAATNTLQMTWLAGADYADLEATVPCIAVGLNDGTLSSTSTLAGVAIDTKDPINLSSLPNEVNSISENTVTFGGWGTTCSATDANFKEYKLHYGTTASLTSASSAWTSSTYSGFGYAACNLNGIGGSTEFRGLATSTLYYFNIFAYDSYGNVSSGTERSFWTVAETPGAPTVSAVTSTDSVRIVLNPGGNPSSVTYVICKGSCGDSQYVQSDGTIGASAVWQTYEAWGGASGIVVDGDLAANTAYTFVARARNGNNEETSASSNGVGYTSANPVTGLSVANVTVTSTLQISLAWTNASQTGLKIERDNGCDGVYDTTIYNDASSNGGSSITTASLSGNTCYRYRFQSYNGGGVANTFTPTISDDITTPPAQVTGLQSDSATESSVTWNWTSVTGATCYDVYDSSSSALIGLCVDKPYTIEGLGANSASSIVIRARNSNGSGIASSAATAYSSATAPTGLGHSEQTASSVRWTWTNGGQSAFYAYDQTTPPNNSGWITDAFWTYSGLSANMAYTVAVKARNGDETETSANTITRYTSQNDPSSLTATGASASSITATLNGTFLRVGTGSSAIVLSNGAGVTETLTDGSASWTNTGLSVNTEYTYTGYATNGDNDQTASVTDTAYTLANAPGTIIVETVSASSLSLTLDRNSNPASTAVRVFETTQEAYVDTAAKTLTGTSESFDTFANWGALVVTGLSPNTGYRFVATARNGDAILTASSTTSTIVYTLANTPANPRATASGKTDVTVTWGQNSNPSVTEYYAENMTVGTNSGWVLSQSWESSGLTCGTTYTFRVKARNATGTETDTESTTVSTDACATQAGGGVVVELLAPPRLPDEEAGAFRIRINGGDTSTDKRAVRLSLVGGPDAKTMAVSENAQFAGGSFESYSSSRLWTLSEGFGLKRVFAKFVTAAGVSSPVVSSTILYIPARANITIATPADRERITSLPFDVAGETVPGYRLNATIASSTYDVTTTSTGAFSFTVLDDLPPGAYDIIFVATDPSGEHRMATTRSIMLGELPVVTPTSTPISATVRPVVQEVKDSVQVPKPLATAIPQSKKKPTVDLVPSPRLTEAVKNVIGKRDAFLLIGQPTSPAFEQAKTGPITIAGDNAIDIVVRPKQAVRSVVAQVYATRTPSVSMTRETWFEKMSHLFASPVLAESPVSEETSVATLLLPFDTNLRAYRGSIAIPKLAPGTYRLALTFNHIDGTRLTMSKPVVSLGSGMVTSARDGAPIGHARVAIFSQNSTTGTFTSWQGDRYLETNPVLTDDDGTYAVTVPPGVYYYTVDAPGHRMHHSSVIVQKTAGIIHDHVTLEPKKYDVLYRIVSWVLSLVNRLLIVQT